MEIYTDAEGEVIFKKYSPIGELSNFAGQYAEVLHKSGGLPIAIMDNDHVIACSGISKREVLERRVTKNIEDLMEQRQVHIKTDKVPGINAIEGYDRQADVVQSDSFDVLYGQASLTESLLGLTFEIFPFSFFQTNSKGAERLYSVVRDFAGDVSGAEVFDLYCGTGTIAQILAGAGASSVTGIEIVEEAVDAARINAGLNHLDNCHFIAGDVLKQIDTLTTRPDLVILDPPRDGIHPKALPKILQFAPERFIYVSCKPTSLVRDLLF